MSFVSNINPIHIVRGLQGFLAILTLGLLAHVAQWFNTNISTPSMAYQSHVPNEIAFAIFVAVFTLLITLPYVLLTPRYFPQLFKSTTKFTILTFEILSMILWFAAFVAVAAFLGKLNVCKGDVCHCAKAGAGVAAIAWLSWGVTSLFALRFCLGSVGGSGGEKGMESSGSRIGRGDRRREKVLRTLKLHSVWTGQGSRNEEVTASYGHANGYGRGYGQI